MGRNSLFDEGICIERASHRNYWFILAISEKCSRLLDTFRRKVVKYSDKSIHMVFYTDEEYADRNGIYSDTWKHSHFFPW